MGLFIEVQVAPEASGKPAVVKKLAEVCPVNIFGQREDGGLDIIQGNVDECTLCELCLDAAEPGAVRVIKLYDEGRALERSA
jgi:ferredoxin-like protein FixX